VSTATTSGMVELRRGVFRQRAPLVAVSLLALLIAAPVLFMILNSFQTTEQMLMNKSALPQVFSLANYDFLLKRTAYLSFLANSLFIAAISTIGTLVASAFAGYALSRYTTRSMTIYSSLLLMVQMFPIIMALIPLFVIFRWLGLINNALSVIIIYTVVHLPFATWMFRSFFDAIPMELEEAAMIDGCSRFQAFLRVVLPLSGPGAAAVAIFSTLFSYNEFFVASIFLRDESKMTVPVGVQMFMQQYATDWGSLMAAATVTMVPTFIVFLFVQKYMISGGIAGSVKG
jgi:ABC-type glycerol-3-phosphate transport system permease component